MFEHISAIAQLISACALAYNIWQTWRVKRNVKKIEIAANGMQEALLAATGKSSLAEGTAAGLVEGHAAGLDQGRNEMRK